MDMKLTAEQEDFVRGARDWLRQAAPRYQVPSGQPIDDIESREAFARFQAWQGAKAEAGWAGLHWPTSYGGQGLSRLHSALFAQEEARFRTPRGDYLNVGPAFAAPTLMEYGTEEDKRRLLPRILSGEEFWCQLFSEPGAGSDLAGIRTRAVRDGDDWVVNGQKIWTTYAQHADWAILVTRHDTSLPKHKGLTYFYVDMRSAGVEPRPIRQIGGASHFNEVFLTNVRVPDAQRLGEVGQGWQVALTTLMNERLGAGFSDAPPTWEQLAQVARATLVGTRPAIENSAVREQLAGWYVQGRGVELIQQRTLSRLAQGQQPGPEASISKLVSAKRQQEMASFALDLGELSGALATPESSVAAFGEAFLDAPGNRIAGGTDEVLLNVLAERVLGLPSDVRLDRDLPFSEVPTGSR